MRQGIRSPTGWSVQRFCCKSKNHLGREYVAAIAVHEKNESLSSLRQFSNHASPSSIAPRVINHA